MKNILSLRSFARLMLSALLGATFVVVAAFGQETSGTVSGTVSDASGARIPGATVKVEGAAFIRTATTDSDGFYRMLQVPPGLYKVSVTASNFASANATDVTVALGKTTELDFSLKVGSVSEQVVVSSDEISRIDPTGSKIQTNITPRVIDSLPKGTNLTSLLKVSPAARPETLSGAASMGQTGGIQVDGASGSENSFIIDGQEVSNFRTGALNPNNNLPFQFVQEIQIKTSGFEAEYGGATGGVINVATNGGSNQFHGEGGIQFEPDSLFAGPRPFLNAFRTGSTAATFRQTNEYIRADRDEFTNYFPAFSLGGPIKSDRLFFFTSYAPQIFTTTRNARYFTSADPLNRTEVASQAQVYKTKVTQEYFQSRLDATPLNNLRLSSTFTWNPIVQDGVIPGGSTGNLYFFPLAPPVDFGGTIGKLGGSQLADRQGGRQNANNVTFQTVYTPTSTLVSSFRFSRGFLNEKLNSYFIPQQTRFQCVDLAPPAAAGCVAGFNSIPNNNNRFFDTSVRLNFEGDVSYILSRFAGRHEFKGGYQYVRVTNDVSTGYIPFGIVSLSYNRTINDLTGRNDPVNPNAIGAGVVQRFGTTGTGSNRAHSIYIQDKWQPINRLSINVGVRFEKEDLPSFNNIAPPINFGFGDKIVPRFGFAYDLTGSGKTKLFASYGRFTDRLKFELPRGSFGGDFFRNDYFEITPDHPEYTFYTLARIIGTNKDVLGGTCPITNSTGLTRCQLDFRIASNDPNGTIETGKVDPNLQPFRQEEFTVGFERELSRNFLISARYSYKHLLSAIEDAGFINAAGSEAYIIGNPGSGLHAQVAQQFGFAKTTKPQRRYDAMEIRLDRRFSRGYFFNASYTYSRLYGNYSGLASTDENGRTSPGVNRFFDLPHLGFTAAGTPDNGRLATDRPHVFNTYGAYDFNWFGKLKGNETRFSMSQTIQSGSPQTSFYTLFAASILYGRGNLGRTPTLSQTDFAFTHRYKIKEEYVVAFDFNVFNLFNQATTLGLQTNLNGINPSISTLNLPATAQTPGSAINYILTNGIVNNFNAFLNDPAFPQRKQTAAGFANRFQGGREIRLGLRFTF
jgi:hypothetical protein